MRQLAGTTLYVRRMIWDKKILNSLENLRQLEASETNARAA